MKLVLGFFILFSIMAETSFYDLSAKDLDGKEIKFDIFKNKVVLIVNTASGCGFAGQYQGLENLHEEFSSKGLVILGFPSNDFLGQEPLSNAEIKNFCRTKYNIKFQVFEKASVKGKDMQPVYKFLTKQGEENTQGCILWNFEKFLIDKEGKIRNRYGSWTKPEAFKIKLKIEELLGEEY